MARARSQAAEARGAHAKERGQFHQLLLKNPNYFGNFPESGLKPILELAGNIFYEQLTCVAYNFSRDELEATVQIKRANGYGGDLCTAGSKEYVRFYVDYGSGWEDAGLASFSVHDIPNSTDCAGHTTKPLTYVATFPHEPRRDWCGQPVLPNVRAILSWSAIPPAGQPNWVQPWGNTLDRHVQIRPRRLIVHDIAVAVAASLGQQLKLPPEFEYLKLEKIPLPEPPDPPIEQLAELYLKSAKAAKTPLVEPHRFALHELQAAEGLALVSQSAPLRQVRTACGHRNRPRRSARRAGEDEGRRLLRGDRLSRARLQPRVAGRFADDQAAHRLPGKSLPEGKLRVRRLLGRLGGHLRLGVRRHRQAQRPRHRVDPRGRAPLLDRRCRWEACWRSTERNARRRRSPASVPSSPGTRRRRPSMPTWCRTGATVSTPMSRSSRRSRSPSTRRSTSSAASASPRSTSAATG